VSSYTSPISPPFIAPHTPERAGCHNPKAFTGQLSTPATSVRRGVETQTEHKGETEHETEHETGHKEGSRLERTGATEPMCALCREKGGLSIAHRASLRKSSTPVAVSD